MFSVGKIVGYGEKIRFEMCGVRSLVVENFFKLYAYYMKESWWVF